MRVPQSLILKRDMKNGKGQIKVNAERMRYSVPGVANRFWKVHIKYILACMLIAVTAVVIAFSYSVIRAVRGFEPKTACVFFCSVEDYEALGQSQAFEKYTPFVDVYFAVYNSDFAVNSDGEEDEKAASYDFSRLGYYMTRDYENPPEDILCVMLDAARRIKTEYKYADAGLENGATLDAGKIASVLKEVTGI